MTTRYFNVKQGITTGNITLDAASGNITGVGNLNTVGTAVAAFFSGDGYQISNIAGGNITGNVANANLAAYVTEAAQSNITSLGNLTGLTVNSNGTVNFTDTGNVTLGGIANLHITGGSNGQLLSTDGSGTLSFVTIDTASLSNGTSNIEILNNGNINFSSAGTANVVVITGSGANVVGTLDVSGNASVGNLSTVGLISATGNVTGGNLVTSGALSVTGTADIGNITVGNITVNADISGNTANFSGLVTLNNGLAACVGNIDGSNASFSANVTASNLTVNLALSGNTANFTGDLVAANISTGGTLTSTGTANVGNLSTAGNVTASGNLSANNATVTNELSAGSLVSNSLTANGTSDLDLTAGTGNANIVLAPSGTGTVDVSAKRITNLGTPTADDDAANKGYVDSVAQGLDVKASVKAATAAALPAVTYNNGTQGVGATLTADANGALPSIDGVTLAADDRVLIKNQSNATHNGIYVVTTLGDGSTAFVLTRATDFDQGSPSGEIPAGFTFVEEGTSYADTGWVCTTNAPVTVGTTNIAFSQFSGAGQYSAGEGLDLTGTVFSVNVDDSTIEISGDQLRIKASAPLVTPNIGAATGTSLNVTGAIDAASITVTGAVSGDTGAFTGNVSAGNITVTGDITAATIGGNLTTATQSNITTVGNLTALTANGNVNFTGASNVSLGDVGNVHIGGGSNGQYLLTDGSGNLSWGTVDTSTLTNGTSNVDIATADGDVTISVGGSANVLTVTSTGANVSGYLTASGNLTVANANLGTLATATYFSGDGSNLANIAGGNVTGQVGNALVAGTVYTNAQPNITSVGTLTGLTVSGVTDLGNVGNVIITGGVSGYVLSTNGSGNLSWIDVGSVGVAGSNTEVQFNDGGSDFGASANFTFNKTTDTLTVTNIVADGNGLSNIAGANVTGQVGNALVAGTVYTAAQPNITSVGTLTSLAVTGNVTAGNVALNGGLTSNRSNVTVSTDTIIDQFEASAFRTAKYVISASGDNGYQSVETLLVHDGTSAYITIYGSISSNVSSDIIDITANINGVSGNVSVYATASGPNTKVNVVASYINV